jgi:hypothetical protein
VRTARLLLFVCLVALWPATAHADWAGWMSWLEELSGPGPFLGPTVSFPVPCRHEITGWGACRLGPGGTQTITIRFSRLSSGNRPRFKDLEGTPLDDRRPVHVWPVSVLWMFHPHRSIEIGPGAGFMPVSGDGFDTFTKLSITPVSASFAPFALHSKSPWASVLRIDLDSSFFPQGFKASDFDNQDTTFRSGPEFLTRFAVGLDFGRLIIAVK